MRARGSEFASLILEDAVQVQKAEIMGMRGQQLARQRLRRSEITIENQNAQVKSLRLEIVQDEARAICRQMDGILDSAPA